MNCPECSRPMLYIGCFAEKGESCECRIVILDKKEEKDRIAIMKKMSNLKCLLIKSV